MTPSDESRGLDDQARRDLVRGALAVVAFVMLSLVVILCSNPIFCWGIVQGLVAPRAEAPLNLSIVHTNDTWGMTKACG